MVEPTRVCPECGFDLDASFTVCVDAVGAAPGRFAHALAGAPATHDAAPGVWSPAEYLWHVVDVLRYGAERLWTLRLDPDAGLMPWDEQAVAAVRARGPRSVPVGLRALAVAAREWVEGAHAAPEGVAARHPELGPLDRVGIARRNAHEVVHHEADVRRGRGGRG